MIFSSLTRGEWLGFLLLFTAVILVITSLYFQHKSRKKERKELEKRIEEGDRKRNEFREFIKTVFNPIEAVHDYLDGKVIVLSQSEYFTYDKNNPKYKVSLRNNGTMGIYNSKNDIYYLVCEIDGREAIVQTVTTAYEPEIETQ